nr:hypothetical protein [Methylorubrum zatmanii]
MDDKSEKINIDNWTSTSPTNASSSPNGPPDVVVLVHGIRDFALWQDSIRSALEESNFIVESTNYGRLNIVQFLVPVAFFRRLAIKKIWRQIRIIKQNYPYAAISIIAHSFGTFVVSQLIKQNFDIKFKRVIFCGSVVAYDFEFENIQGRYLAPILNEVGTRDVWPAIAESVTFGYGSAGTYGFRRPLVRDRWHNGAHHGYFLDRKFCSEFWIPFLKNGTVVRGADTPEGPRKWIQVISIFKIKYIVIFLVLLSIGYGLLGAYKLFLYGEGRTELPSASTYCADIKAVIQYSADKFTPILGRLAGDNRIPTIPLEEWEDCIIFMDNMFSSSRRYSCQAPGFSTQAAAVKSGQAAAKELVDKCLGDGYAVSAGRDTNQIPRWRIVGRSTNATVTIRPSKDRLSPNWNLYIDVE